MRKKGPSRGFIITLILLACVGIMLFSSSDKKTAATPPSIAKPTATPNTVEYLGDRGELARHFEHYFKITDWRHITRTGDGRDKTVGVSDDEQIVISFRNDPVTLAVLAVALDSESKVRAEVIVAFLQQLLDSEQFAAAIKLLDGGGELTFADRHVSMYHDVEIRKAFFEIKWVGE